MKDTGTAAKAEGGLHLDRLGSTRVTARELAVVRASKGWPRWCG